MSNINKAILDKYIAACKSGIVEMKVFLTNGVKIDGFLIDYDDTCLAISKNGDCSLVKLNSIATIYGSGMTSNDIA